MKFPTAQARSRALKKAIDKYLFYYNLCDKVICIYTHTLILEGVDLLQTSDKYNRVIRRATDKRAFWQAEVDKILDS